MQDGFTHSIIRGTLASMYVVFTSMMAIGILLSIYQLSLGTHALSEKHPHNTKTYDLFRQTTSRLTKLEQLRTQTPLSADKTVHFEQQLSAIQVEIQVGQVQKARQHLSRLEIDMNDLQRQLDQAAVSQAGWVAPPPGAPVMVPILMYHQPPDNFDAQLSGLQQRGYTTISMDQLDAALLASGPLPTKPVIITFDDGLSSQLPAYASLKARGMKATFYIISGGERSRWCIGAARRYNDPLQPPSGCGDAYMNWDEIKMIDTSGYMTIGGHTLDHVNLASLSPDAQQTEIRGNKIDIEHHLGHPIKHFAYPYGSFSGTTIDQVTSAGYADAVSTLPGSDHSATQLFTLHRERDAGKLP